MIMKPKRSRVRFIKPTLGEKIFDALNILFMLTVCAMMLLPMIHVLNVSLSQASESGKNGFFMLPRGEINFLGYLTVLQDPMLIRSYLNTILYCAGSILFTLFFTALTAYPLSIPGFVIKKSVTIFLAITMFFSGGMVPTYLLIRSLGLIDNILVMMIPFCVVAFNVILFRTFFSGIPGELREAAMIDGASEFYVLFKMYFPLSKAIFATIGLFVLVAKWNDWFTALLYLNNEKMYPMQMILRKIINSADYMGLMNSSIAAMVAKRKITTQNINMAAIIITILPVICVYPFLQKYFVKGVFIGTIKG